MFEDDPHLGVFVSVPMMAGEEPVLVVWHDEDGDRTFTGPTDVTSDEDDISGLKLVCLHHVLDQFPEVAAIADLPRGWCAERPEAGTAFSMRIDPGWDD